MPISIKLKGNADKCAGAVSVKAAESDQDYLEASCLTHNGKVLKWKEACNRLAAHSEEFTFSKVFCFENQESLFTMNLAFLNAFTMSHLGWSWSKNYSRIAYEISSVNNLNKHGERVYWVWLPSVIHYEKNADTGFWQATRKTDFSSNSLSITFLKTVMKYLKKDIYKPGHTLNKEKQESQLLIKAFAVMAENCSTLEGELLHLCLEAISRDLNDEEFNKADLHQERFWMTQGVIYQRDTNEGKQFLLDFALGYFQQNDGDEIKDRISKKIFFDTLKEPGWEKVNQRFVDLLPSGERKGRAIFFHAIVDDQGVIVRPDLSVE